MLALPKYMPAVTGLALQGFKAAQALHGVCFSSALLKG